MIKIIQIQMNEQTLVALCNDGTVWQLNREGKGWYALPDISVVISRPTFPLAIPAPVIDFNCN